MSTYLVDRLMAEWNRMPFVLSSRNVAEYLVDTGLCSQQEIESIKIEVKPAKNFNLLVSAGEHHLLVKQERQGKDGQTVNEFFSEWRFHQLLQAFPELGYITPFVSEVLHFDQDNSIIVYRYLTDYLDLDHFYRKEQIFSTAIAHLFGKHLATLHRLTLNRQDYQTFISQTDAPTSSFQIPSPTKRLERISPEIFGMVPADCIKFFVLYQRFDSLGKAIAELTDNWQFCCITHNDLKLNNILIQQDWERSLLIENTLEPNALRLIDWERCNWGDPAFDVGSGIAGYLQLWINSLVIDPSAGIEAALRLAGTPLELLQPSLTAFLKAYLSGIPNLLDVYPNFIGRAMQFAGLALIQQIFGAIQHQKYFGNASICLLQVAKSLLCRPQASIPTVFGVSEAEFAPFNQAVHQLR